MLSKMSQIILDIERVTNFIKALESSAGEVRVPYHCIAYITHIAYYLVNFLQKNIYSLSNFSFDD